VKLHPEVVSGRKAGHLADVLDDVDTRVLRENVNPWSLIEVVDKVYVVTSQMRLEAVLAGRDVVCFGAPFYAGWGLTDDRVGLPRRTARPSLEQLFAAVYFDYSRYISPVTCREISFEQAVDWIVSKKSQWRLGVEARTGCSSWRATCWKAINNACRPAHPSAPSLRPTRQRCVGADIIISSNRMSTG
jgi:capsular polysaccharide export protein